MIFYICCVVVFFFMYKPFGFFFAGHVAENLRYMMDFAAQARAGLLPYRDVAVEYPPLSAGFLWALAPFSASLERYQAAFTIIMTVVSGAALPAVIKLAAPDEHPIKIYAATFTYTAAVICAGPIGIVSLDYIPATLSVWALCFLVSNRIKASALFLAAAVAAKGYPLILLPVFLFNIRSDYAVAKRFAATFAASMIFFILPALALSPSGLLSSFSYHAERGIEIGSLYGAAILLLKRGAAEAVFGHGGWNVEAGALSAAALKLSGPIMLGLLAVAAIGAWKRKSLAPADLCASSCALLLAAMIGFKVGSPQFLCWVVPFAAVYITSRRAYRILPLLCGAGLAGLWIFPWHMQMMVGLNPAAVNMLALKWVFLLALYGYFVKVVFSPLGPAPANNRT